jgi:hypothetical protein
MGKSKCRGRDNIKANLQGKARWRALDLAGSGTV